MYKLYTLYFSCLAFALSGQTSPKLLAKVDKLADECEAKVIDWRRDFHQYPELSNREFKTAKKIAAHLKSLGLEVQEKVAHTGVVALLKGGKPGKIVALRADIDGLPVVEKNDLPFASKVKTTYNGQDVGVMHACGHDTHIAILMGVAEVLTKVQKNLKGTVKFIFQPAEEGAPEGEEGGAKLMVKEGVMENPKPDAVFGLHINSVTQVNTIGYRPGGTMASSDFLRIKVIGDQTHGGYPWNGTDPVVISAQIILGLQTIVSRQVQLIKAPAVVTVATIHGGVRNNIIPSEVEMTGTIRNLDPNIQNSVHDKIKQTAENIAVSGGAKAIVEIKRGYPVTYNDPKLVEKMLPTLKRVAGEDKVFLRQAVTGAEDFSYYAQKAPGFFFFLGGMPKGKDPKTAAPHHTPDFFIDESGLLLGVKALSNLTIDYLNN